MTLTSNCRLKSFPILLLLLVSATALGSGGAGNGGAYNGPSLEGDAVPLEGDRGFTLQSVIKATEECLYELGGAVWEQVYKADFKKSLKFPSESGGSSPPVFEPIASLRSLDFSPNSCTYTYQLSVTGITSLDLVRIEASRCQNSPSLVTVYLQGNAVDLHLPVALPYLRSRSHFGDSIYDDLGRVDLTKIGNQQLPVDLVLPGQVGRVRLKNLATLAESKISIDLDRHSLCLRSRLK